MKLLFTLCALLALAAMSWAQEPWPQASVDFFPQLHGTRELAMGGAFVAVNTGVNALLGNPAGLALPGRAELVAGGRSHLFGQWGRKSDVDPDKYRIDPKVMTLGGSIPIALSSVSAKFAGGVAYRSVYDWRRKVFEEEAGSGGRKTETTDYTKGVLNALAFGLGATFSEKYSFGISLNVPFMQGFSEEYESVTNISGTGGNNEIWDSEWEVSGGSFFQMGTMLQIAPALRLGAAYVGGHHFEVENGKWKTRNDEGEYDSDEDLSMEYPGSYVLGVALTPSPAMLLTAELQNRRWEDVEVNGRDFGRLNGAEDGTAYRFGLESGKEGYGRLGFSIDRLPFLDATDDPVSVYGLHGGFGTPRSKAAALDVGFVFRWAKYDVETLEYVNGRYQTRMEKASFTELLVNATLSYNFNFRIGGGESE